MSERERWVVYPLLFLALGAALRDKLFDRTTTKSIVCQELTIVEEEPIGHQPVRVLAKIGRTERTAAGGTSNGYFLLNGQLEIVDRDPIAHQVVRSLVKIGRTDAAAGAPSAGYAIVNGQVVVNGAINATQYAFQGIPFMSAIQGMLQGVTPEMLRSLQQLQQKRQEESAPATEPRGKDSPAPSPPAAEKLADPAANR